jgi:hypothetical protein
MLFKALPESRSKPIIRDQSVNLIPYTSELYIYFIFNQQKFVTIASMRTTGLLGGVVSAFSEAVNMRRLDDGSTGACVQSVTAQRTSEHVLRYHSNLEPC